MPSTWPTPRTACWLGEEHGASGTGSDVVWVLDPIDGTAPFIAGVPVFGTLIS